MAICSIVYLFKERLRNVEGLEYLNDEDMNFFLTRIPFLDNNIENTKSIRFRIFTYRTTSETIEFYKTNQFILQRSKFRSLKTKMNDF